MTESKTDRERCWYVRAMRPSDREYVRLTWLSNYRETGTGVVSKMPRDLYRKVWGKVIDHALKRCDIRIACTDDDADTIVGFAVLESKLQQPAIHYVYTREGWRELGVARDLVADLVARECAYSHATQALERGATDGAAARAGAKVPGTWKHAPWILIMLAMAAGGDQ